MDDGSDTSGNSGGCDTSGGSAAAPMVGAGLATGEEATAGSSPALHSAHGGLVPRKTSNASTGETSLQNGHKLMTASHSSLHPHRLQLFSRHPQQMAWVQHPK